ncbi:MAG: zinc-ribbon domain-containing protein [Candidatus Atribacteria bacterium]|nr:zinc-ribbon domain-containing protein [Candidatus Atribacteria bacterium]
MIDLSQWHQAIKAALEDYIPDEEEEKIGACPKCGKKVSPDFKLCPYCGCRLS